MITIQTSVQETFREASQEAASEDVFSQHFETDIQKLETENHTSETDKVDKLISVTPPSPPSSSPTSSRVSPAKSCSEDHHQSDGSEHTG